MKIKTAGQSKRAKQLHAIAKEMGLSFRARVELCSTRDNRFEQWVIECLTVSIYVSWVKDMGFFPNRKPNDLALDNLAIAKRFITAADNLRIVAS